MSFQPTNPLPLLFGGIVACGLPSDELTGPVNLPLYSTGSASMTFSIPSAQSSIQVAVCLASKGGTAPVVLSLYNSAKTTLLATANLTGIPSTAGWTGFATLTANLAAGYYTIAVSSPSSTSSSYYLVYINLYPSFVDPSARASYSPAPGQNGNSGSPVVWVKDSSGNDLTIFPFGVSGDTTTVGNGTFTAESSYQINALVPWLSDMEYLSLPYSASFVLTDTTTGSIVGTASATQTYDSHGVQGLIPLQFPESIDIVEGHSYSISISESGNAGATSAYPVLVRGSKVNPAQAGPGGSAAYWLGGLSNSDWSQYRVLDYGSTTTTLQDGHGAIGGTDMIAVRFIPNFTETLTSVKLKMANSENAVPVAGNYPSGTAVIISLYASNESYVAPYFAAPSGSALASATADSGTIPLVGFFSASVSFPVTAGRPYWIVWSSPAASTSEYDVQRCISPIGAGGVRGLALATKNSGSSWAFFDQGPTDLAWSAESTQETLGSPFDNTISTKDSVAQPFILSQSGSLNAVYVQASGGTVTATVYSDSSGPDIPLGSGTFDTAFQYFYSGIIIPFMAPVPIQANTKYWVVISGASEVLLATYWLRPSDPDVPVGYDALVSSGASSWGAVGTESATAIFMVGMVPAGGSGLVQVTIQATVRQN